MAAPVTYVRALKTSDDYNACFGGGLSEGNMWEVFTAEPLASTASVESAISAAANGIIVNNYKYFGIWVKGASSGTCTFDVKIQQSFNDTAANYCAPATNATVGSVSGTAAIVMAVGPSPMPYLRFQITGTGSNDASTTVTLYFWAMR